MNARERLIVAGASPSDLDAYRDEVLGEAVGKLRTEFKELDGWPRGRYWKGYLASLRDSADLILKTD